MAGWIVRRPDDEETKKKTPELPVADARLAKYAQTPQAVLPAGSLKPKNTVDEAKKLLERQNTINTPKVGILPRYTEKAQAPTLSTMPKVDVTERAKAIAQKAQGKTPQQMREQNIANIKERLSGADARIAFEKAMHDEFEPNMARALGTIASVPQEASLALGTLGTKAVEKVAGIGGENRVSKWAGEQAQKYANTKTIAEQTQEMVAERYPNQSKMGKQVGNMTEMVTRVLAQLGIGQGLGAAAGAGAGLGSASVAPQISKTIMGLTAGHGGMKEALNEGATEDQAVLYGTTIGLLEAEIESLFGGIAGLGEGLLDDAVKAMWESPALHTLIDTYGEIGEEEISLYLSPLIKRAIYDKDAEMPTIADAIETAGTTALVTLLLKGATGDLDLRMGTGQTGKLMPATGENAKAGQLAGALTEGATPNWGKNIAESQRKAPEMPPQEVAPQVQEVAPPVQETPAQPETATEAQTQTAQTMGEVKRPASLRQRVALPEEITYAPDQADRSNSADNAPEAAAEMLRNSNDGMLMTTLGDLEDVADQIDGSGSYMNLDIARVLDKVAGNNQELRTRLHNAIEKPLTNAKAGYAQNVVDRMKQYKADMDRLGIKVGSKESAAVQWYGEGQRQINANGETVPYSFEQLKVEFPNNWQNIVDAEKIHRQIYDEYVERINAALSLVYPDVEGNAKTELLEKQDKMNQALEKLALQQELVQTLQDKVKTLTQQTKSTDPVAATRAKQELLKATRQVGVEMNRAGKLSADAKKAVDNHDKLEAEINSGAYYKNKRLMPRKDYFHHFVDMEKSGSLQSLKNILNRPSDIAAELVGKSDFTKPKSKFWGAMQHRTGAAYTEDAVAGMARYIPQAEYKINIDPLIAQMRGTVKSLVDGSSATRNANGFIEFLTDWTNDLAGKTNPIDRAAQKIVGRKTMKVLEWVNNRVKANAVVGNLGSAIVQIGNIPNATTYVPNAAYWTKAAATMANAEKAQTLLAQSPFLNERYMGSTTSMFDQKGALQKGAEWVLEIGDHKASELIWLAAYNQYEATDGKVNGPRQYDNAVDYADDVTRRSVAGRGIGELPLIQRSRVVKLFAPFQVEVNNSWNLMKEQIGAKNAKGLLAYCVNAWITNSIIEAIANKRPLFDPIQALIDAIKELVGDEEEEGSAGEAAKRLFGEVAANVPYATALAPMFFDTDDMEKVFGEQDPTRYGTGLSATADLMTQAGNLLNDKPVDWLGLATTYVTPYGGQQLERVVRAGQNFGYLPRRVVVDEEGNTELKRVEVPGSYNTSGKLRFGIEPTAGKLAVNAAFGDYAIPEGREYIEGGYQPMSEKQTVMASKAAEMGIPANTITWVIRNKGKTQEDAAKAIRQTVGLTKQQKAWLWKEVTGGADKNNPFK